MAMGKKKARQEALWVAIAELPRTRRHVFYDRVNPILREHGFDEFAEAECPRFHKSEVIGRSSIAPGLLPRADSWVFRRDRFGAWDRPAMSGLAELEELPGYGLTELTPDHSTVSRTRRLVDLYSHGRVFTWVLTILANN